MSTGLLRHSLHGQPYHPHRPLASRSRTTAKEPTSLLFWTFGLSALSEAQPPRLPLGVEDRSAPKAGPRLLFAQKLQRVCLWVGAARIAPASGVGGSRPGGEVDEEEGLWL